MVDHDGTWFSVTCDGVSPGGDPIPFGSMEAGPTPLIAAMRCIVALQFGEEVEIND